MSDERWVHGMNGWRVQVVNPKTALSGSYGEVTGFRHGWVYVVLDGRDDPLLFSWAEVRPA